MDGRLEIPTDPLALTPAWLTAALRAWGGAGDVVVAAVEIAPLLENEGFYGQLQRVHLHYACPAAGAPHTLIAKLSAPTPEMRARAVDSYAREVRFYRELAARVALATPVCYYAALDEAQGWHVILLQDLAPMRGGARVAGCTVDEARRAVAAIAQLHVRGWGQVAQRTYDWLAGGEAMGDPAQVAHRYAGWWQEFYAAARHNLPEALVTPSATLGQRSAAIRHRVFGGGAQSTLIHRDFHLGNLFFADADAAEGEQGSRARPAFAVVDWQFLSRGLGVWDVAYFLSENVLPEVRRTIEMQLLRDYHATITAQGIVGYSFAQCYDDYRLALLQRHTALVSTIAAMPFSAAQRRIHVEVLLPRNVAALQEHDCFAWLARWDS